MNQVSKSVREHWRQIIEQQKRSGLSIARFCGERRIAESSLFTWKRRLARESLVPAAPAFVPVKLAAADQAGEVMGPSHGAIELHLGQGRHLVLRPGFDAPTLATVLAVLAGETSRPEPR
jgi:hypothetical protein